jgi:hypothetical protein
LGGDGARVRATLAFYLVVLGSLSLRHPGEGRDPVPFLFIPAKTSHLVIPAEAGIHLPFF